MVAFNLPNEKKGLCYESILAAMREHSEKFTDEQLEEALHAAALIGMAFEAFCIAHELHLREMERTQ